jgi:uroporphyrinogen-III synthase
MNPLSGQGILVTRPADQAAPLCELIEEAGGRAIRFPLIEIEPVLDAPESIQQLLDLAGDDWLIFVSANAVKFALELVPAGAQSMAGPRIGAVGQATAEALEAAGLQVDLVPKPQFNSEALLAMPELADVEGRKVVIVRGEGGRELIAETLRSRGAKVTYAEVYRRTMPKQEIAEVVELWRSGGVQAVTLTSGEMLQHLVALLGEANRELLTSTPVVVVSERIAQVANDIGCRRVVTAQGPNDQAVLQAVVEIMQENLTISRTNGETPLADEDKEIQPELNQSDVIAEPVPAAVESPVVPAKKAHFGAWLGYLSLGFVLLLAVGGFFLLQELRSKQEGLGGELNKGDQQMLEITRQITGLQSELATLHSQLATMGSQVTTEDSKFERELGEQGASFSEKLDTTRSDLAASIQHIQRQMNQTRGDLMVADAEYLLSVANQKLHLVGDVKAVIAMMEAADQRLYDSGDPAAFKVREALAEEITLLKSIAPADIVGASAKLLVLEGKVKELPLFLPHSNAQGEDHTVLPQGEEAATPEQTGALGTALKSFKDLVTVRRSDRPINAILVPEEVAAIRQVMLLRLEMARAALLRGDQALLEANVDSALAWLQENFDGDTAPVQDIAAELKGLRELKIQVPFPDVSKSLSMLRNIERLRVETEKAQASPKATAPARQPVQETPPEPIPTPQSPPAQSAPETSPGPEVGPQPEAGTKP